MENFLPQRKSSRLKDYDYSTPGAYFVTICTHHHKCMLSNIVGTGVLDCPQNKLTHYGEIVNKYICKINEFYDNIVIDKYVIMPNHIHMLIRIMENGQPLQSLRQVSPDTSLCTREAVSVPAIGYIDRANSIVPKFVSTLKRFCNKEYGKNIWQARYHDHIIRDKNDYISIWEYIDTNVLRWEKDCFYSKGE